MAKFADRMEKIAGGVAEGYQKIEDSVVTGYKKIENGVVEGFNGITDKVSGVILDEEGKLKTGKVGDAVVGAYKKVEDAFVNTFMAKEGETTQKAQTASLTVGIIGALTMGTGMSFAMTDLGSALGSLAMVIGIAVGIVGMVLAALAYPLYNRVLKKQRERIAPEILRLSDELLK